MTNCSKDLQHELPATKRVSPLCQLRLNLAGFFVTTSAETSILSEHGPAVKTTDQAIVLELVSTGTVSCVSSSEFLPKVPHPFPDRDPKSR